MTFRGLKPFVLFFCGAVLEICQGTGVLPDTLNTGVGDTVNFSTTISPPLKPFVSISWKVNERDIITSTSTDLIAPGYEGRVTLDKSTGSLELRILYLNDSGQYTVSLTPDAGFQIVGTTTLAVYEKVSNGVILPKDPDVLEGNSTTLTCDAAGSISTREWMKDGLPLPPNDRITISEENKTLSILLVNRIDSGAYQCTVENPVSSVKAVTNVRVIYGPENVRVEGPSQVELGAALRLKCTAQSSPTATYTWMLNETVITGNKEDFTKEIADYADSGRYTCITKNDATGQESRSEAFLVKVVAVVPASGLPAGVIAGIVIGVLVLVSLLAVLIVFLVKKKRIPVSKHLRNNRLFGGSRKGKTNRTAGNSAGFDSGAGPGEQEVNYADITRFRTKDGGVVKLGNTASTSRTNDQLTSGRLGQASSLPTYDVHMQKGNAGTTAPQPAQEPETIYSDVRRS